MLFNAGYIKLRLYNKLMAILFLQLWLGIFHTKQNMLLCCVNISKLVFNTGNKFGPSANTLLNQCHDMTTFSHPSGKVHVRPKLVTSCSCHDNGFKPHHTQVWWTFEKSVFPNAACKQVPMFQEGSCCCLCWEWLAWLLHSDFVKGNVSKLMWLFSIAMERGLNCSVLQSKTSNKNHANMINNSIWKIQCIEEVVVIEFRIYTSVMCKIFQK